MTPPSKWVASFVPGFVERRRPELVARGLSSLDAIATGEGEGARAQRMALFAFTVRIVSAALAYVTQVFLARIMGGFEYGIFVLVWVAVVIAGYLSCMGFPSAVLRFVPQMRIAGDGDGIRGIMRGSRLMAGTAATIVAVTAIVVLAAFPGIVTSYYVWPVFLGAACLPLLAIGDVQDGLSRSFDLKAQALVPTFLLRPGLILVTMIGAVLWGFEPTAVTALGCAIVSTWVSTLVQTLWLARGTRTQIEPGPRRASPKTWLVVALPIFLVEGFFQLLTNVDILMVGRFMSPQDVAVYFATVKTLALVHFVYFAVKAGAAHRYAHYHRAGDREAYAAFVAQTVRWTFWPSVAMSALIVLAGPYLLELFGEGFSRGAPLLWILVVGIIARAAVGPAEAVLTMSGEQNACAGVYGTALVTNIVLNATFLPLWGLHGAAFATSCALVFEAVALYAIVRRRLSLDMFVVHARGVPGVA